MITARDFMWFVSGAALASAIIMALVDWRDYRKIRFQPFVALAVCIYEASFALWGPK